MHRPLHRNIQVHGGNVGRPPLSRHIHAAPHRGTERGRTPRSRRRDFRQRRGNPHRRYAIASAHRRRSAAGVAATCEPPRLRISDTPICHSGIAGGRRRSRPYAHPCEPPRLRTSGTPICDKHRRRSTASPPLARIQTAAWEYAIAPPAYKHQDTPIRKGTALDPALRRIRRRQSAARPARLAHARLPAEHPQSAPPRH